MAPFVRFHAQKVTVPGGQIARPCSVPVNVQAPAPLIEVSRLAFHPYIHNYLEYLTKLLFDL